jgi:uroporphyrinogen-III decarboxylase
MNGKRRIASAMRHEEPDRVPVMCQLALGHYFLNTRFAPHEIWFTSEAFAEALVELQRRYRFDGILINIPGRPQGLLDEAKSIRETDEGEELTWVNGDVTLIPWDDNAQHYQADGSMARRADFDTLDPEHLDSIDDLAGYVWNTYHVPWVTDKPTRGPMTQVPDYFFHTFDLVKGMVGEEVSVHGEVFSPFTHYLELFGYEEALMGLIKDSGKAHALLERLAQASITWGVAQTKHDADAVLISSAFAGGGFVSPKMKAAGGTVYTHTCGHLGDRLEAMLETGTMGIDTLDPPPLGNTTLEEAKSLIGDKVFLKGNMNGVEILAFKTEGEVIDHATERVRVGMPGSGYILSTACSVPPKVEPWKLELLAPLAEEIGQY